MAGSSFGINTFNISDIKEIAYPSYNGKEVDAIDIEIYDEIKVNKDTEKAIFSNTKDSNISFSASISGKYDPLSQIDRMLSKYFSDLEQKANRLADEYQQKSNSLSEVSRLWGVLMTQCLPEVDPAKTSTKVNIQHATLNALTRRSTYTEIDNIILFELGEPKGIDVITNGLVNVNYDQLQSMNATQTAFSETMRVDLEKLSQDVKNLMTMVTSAKEEIRNVRQAAISVSTPRS